MTSKLEELFIEVLHRSIEVAEQLMAEKSFATHIDAVNPEALRA